jgi:mono/diheme cytochrome c family protein
MMRGASTALACTGLVMMAVLPSAWAQGADQSLNDTQRLGRALFAQSCGVCHTNVQRTSARYGPALSKDSLGGQDDVMRDVIGNGTPRMPGFKYHFERGEIDAIVAYLKTVPAPQPAAPQPAAQAPGGQPPGGQPPSGQPR